MSQIDWTQVTLLIAEDEDDLRDILVSIFECEGCQVIPAKDGLEAATLLDRHSVDIVISDIRMPRCDGIQLLEMINKRSPPRPLFFLATGFADINPQIAKEKGAAELILKPYTIPDLLGILESQLSRVPRFLKAG